VAEGIEDQETLDLVRSLAIRPPSGASRRIHGVQGYLLGLPATDFGTDPDAGAILAA
jgi:hypothetical protein